MAVNKLVENDQIISDLRGALRDGQSGLKYVPKLLRRVLEDGAWRERIDAMTHAEVGFSTFAEFVTTAPSEGLGADMALIERIVGTDDPDLLRLMRDARKGRPGRPAKGTENPCESQGFYGGTDYVADRLAQEAPAEYEAVKRGEKSIHAAAIAAGIRRRRIPIRLDSAVSAAGTLRKHMPPEQIAVLLKLLTD